MALHVGGAEEEGTAMSDINVTPLVDVMLVLLIIFISHHESIYRSESVV